MIHTNQSTQSLIINVGPKKWYQIHLPFLVLYLLLMKLIHLYELNFNLIEITLCHSLAPCFISMPQDHLTCNMSSFPTYFMLLSPLAVTQPQNDRLTFVTSLTPVYNKASFSHFICLCIILSFSQPQTSAIIYKPTLMTQS